MAQERRVLYSLADWRFHNNKLGYDDLIDKDGQLVVTVNVMDFAKDEMLESEYLEMGVPKKMFVLDEDKHWSIYLNVKWLTPQNIQQALDEFGRLVSRTYKFEPYILPEKLKRKYRESRKKTIQELENERARGQLRDADEFLKELKRDRETEEKKPPKVKKEVPDKRLAEIIAHKLKF